MDTTIAGCDERSLNRFEGLTSAKPVRKQEPAHRVSLTNRDIEAEVLARLARQGYDWIGVRTTKSTEGPMKPRRKEKTKKEERTCSEMA